MTNKLLILSILFLFAAACKKEEPAPEPVEADTTAPVITLKGKAKDTISLDSLYIDPGATALDETDGDLTSQLSIVGTVDGSREGSNRIYYTVHDAAGNHAQVIRDVYVRNDAYRLTGNYNVVSNCGGSFTGITFTSAVQMSTMHNNQISITKLQFQTGGFYVSAKVIGNSLNMYTQPVGSGLASGTGTIAADLRSFTLSTTYTPAISGSSGCVSVYTRQ